MDYLVISGELPTIFSWRLFFFVNEAAATINFTDQNPKNEDELLKSLGLGLTRHNIQNDKKFTERIPELEELVDTGIVTNTIALAIMKTYLQRNAI